MNKFFAAIFALFACVCGTMSAGIYGNSYGVPAAGYAAHLQPAVSVSYAVPTYHIPHYGSPIYGSPAYHAPAQAYPSYSIPSSYAAPSYAAPHAAKASSAAAASSSVVGTKPSYAAPVY